MIPLFFMPAFMQKLAVFSVNYWSIQAFYDILGRDADWAVFIWKAGVLIAIAAGLTAIPFICSGAWFAVYPDLVRIRLDFVLLLD
jgi:hypothetical protein